MSPHDREYETPADRGRVPKDEFPDHVKESWDAICMFDSEQGAREASRATGYRIGRFIVRYDIPDGAGIRWQQYGPDGHYGLRGEVELLKSFLAADYHADADLD